MGARHTPSPALPPAFEHAVSELQDARWRPELAVEEIPAPQRIAPFAIAISADVRGNEGDVGGGRLILLHDPAGNPAWDGDFRCVTFARAAVDPEIAADPLLAEVGWSWLLDALTGHDATFTAPSGTVTTVSSRAFGAMADEPVRADVEIRASWTPVLQQGHGLHPHLLAWSDLLCLTAGLPPLPPGVILLPRERGRPL